MLLASLALVLGACGDDVEEKEVGSVDSSEKGEETEEVEEVEDDVEEINKDVVDTDVAKITLVDIQTVFNDGFDTDTHIVNFDIENKSDKDLVVQTDKVSADGKMVTDMVTFSVDVAAGKKADGKLEIINFDGDLPELEEELEMVLLVMDDESYDRLIEQDVKIDLD